MDPWRWGRSWGSEPPGPAPQAAHVSAMASGAVPPVLVGERVLWLGSGSGIPQGAVVRWMGKLPEMGPSWTLGIELDVALPFGGIDGWWGGRRLFACEPRRGLLVPLSSVAREPPSPGPGPLPGWQHQQHQQHYHHQQQQDWADHLQDHGGGAPPEYFNAGPGQPYPKPAVRRKNTGTFVQSLPLVEEETRQAVYDTRDHVLQQQDEAAAAGSSSASTATAAPSVPGPSAPPRLKNGVRLTRSGDYSAFSWQLAGPSTSGQPSGPSVGQDPVEASGPVRSSSAEALQAGHQPRPSSGYGLFSFFRWFKKGGKQAEQPDGADERTEDVDQYDDEEYDDDDDDDDGYLRSGPGRATSFGSIDTVLSTATVNSFAFVQPGAYPLGAVSPVPRRGFPAADTDSYRQRIRQRDRRRESERGVSLRRKYRLYGSDSTIHSLQHRSHTDLSVGTNDRRQSDVDRKLGGRHADVDQGVDGRQTYAVRKADRLEASGYQTEIPVAPVRRQSDTPDSLHRRAGEGASVRLSEEPKAPDRRRSDTSQTPDRRQSDVSQTPDRRQSDASQTPDRHQSDVSHIPTRLRSDASQTPDRREKDVSQTPERAQTIGPTRPNDSAPVQSQAPDEAQSQPCTSTAQSDLVGSTRSSTPLTSGSYPDVVVPTLGRKKRRAPEPPPPNPFNDYSLPATLEHRAPPDLTGPLYESATLHIGRYEHRRSASDTSTDKRPAHVRGKRRAPTPPCEPGAATPDGTPYGTPFGTPSGTLTGGKKKRPAPQPPGWEEERLERLRRQEKARQEEERQERERLEKERLEKERQEKERLENERIERERLERERLEKERLEKEKQEKERLEKEKQEQERQEKERQEKERAERDRLERERVERERERELMLERQKLEKERLERELIEREKEKLRQEVERLERERNETERLLQEKNEKERLEQENIKRLEREIKLAQETLERERLEKEKLDRQLRLDRNKDKKGGGAGLSAEERERLLGNINKLQAHAARIGSPPGSPRTPRATGSPRTPRANSDICRPQAAKENMAPGVAAAAPGPVSPRPWYKRSSSSSSSSSSSHRDSGGFRDIFRSLEKRHKKSVEEEEWMPESGVPRSTGGSHGTTADSGSGGSSHGSRFNIFSRLTEDWRGEKRKSTPVSMLPNISELDREAAEIVQEQHAREAALQAKRDAKFYASPAATVAGAEQEPEAAEVSPADDEDLELPRKNSAKELISLFNAISSIPGSSAVFGKVPEAGPSASTSASSSQEDKRTAFAGARSKSSDADDRPRAQSPTGPLTRRQFASIYETGAEAAALSEEAFRVTAPIANVDDDSDLALYPSATPKAVNGHAAPSSSITTDKKDFSVDALKITSTVPALAKTATHSISDRKLPAVTAPETATPPTLEKKDPLPSAAKVAVSLADKAAVDSERVSITQTPRPVTLNGLAMWVCPRCTLENPRWRFTCDACSMWRPAERRSVREDDADVPTGPPAFLNEDKRAQDKALEKASGVAKATSGINWEVELKRYLDKDGKASVTGNAEKPSTSTSSQHTVDKVHTQAAAPKPAISQLPLAETNHPLNHAGVQAVKPQPASSAMSSQSVASTKVTPTAAAPVSAPVSAPVTRPTMAPSAGQQTAVVKPQQSTFIGGRLPNDRPRAPLAKSKSEDMTNKHLGHLLGGQGPQPRAATDVEELRRARIAFFRNSACVEEDAVGDLASAATQTRDPPAPHLTEDRDRFKLREMLKEMKDSLAIKHGDSAGPARRPGVGAGVAAAGGRVGPEVPAEASEQKNNPVPPALVGAVAKPTKVSSSAQTSAQVVRKVEPTPARPAPAPQSRAPAPQGAEPVVQDGVLYTSLRRDAPEARRLGTGMFELIRPRDFATRASSGPLYMNVLPRPSVQRHAAVAVAVAAAAPAKTVSPSAALDSSPERRSTTESAEFATPSSSAASSAAGGLSSRASSAGGASRSSSLASFSSSPSDAGETGVPLVPRGRSAASFASSPSGGASGLGLSRTSSAASPRLGPQSSLTSSSRASSVETPPSSAGRLSRDASVESSASGSASASGPSRSLSVVSDCSEVDRLTEQLTVPQGIADFRAALNRSQTLDANGMPDVNTLAVNRLLRRLEATIAGGQHQEAARLAKDLARLKISCCVTRQPKQQDSITVDMYVEDKLSHQGPIPLQVTPSMTVGELAAKVAREFQLPEHVQRWILGKQLAQDLQRTLRDHNVSESGCPVFLYLVAPEADAEADGDGSSASGHSSSGDRPSSATLEGPGPRRLPPPPAVGNRRGGWYYNYEEDRYSFCEDSDEDLSDGEPHAQPTVATEPTLVESTPTPAPRRITSPSPVARMGASPVPASTSPAPRAVASPEPAARRVTSPIPAARVTSSPTPAARDASSPTPAARGVASSPTLAAPAASPGRPTPTVRAAEGSPVPTPRKGPASASTPGPVAQPQHPPVRPQTSGYRSQPLQTVLATATTNTTTIANAPSSPPPTRATAAGPFHRQAAATAASAAPSTSSATSPAASAVASPAAPTAASTVASAAPAATASGSQVTQFPGSWRCPRCTLLNSGVRPGCAACTAERPAATFDEGLDADELERQRNKERERQYQLLVNLERQDLVPSTEHFECPVCLTEYGPGDGAVLRECLHTFCRACLINTVQFSDDAEVKCPYRDKQYACDGILQEREIKALVPAALYEQHLAKSMTQAERKMDKAFHCKTPDCTGWCVFEDNVNEFRCPVCRATNCLTCQAIHADNNCAEYQARLQREAADGSNEDARRTQAMLEEMVARGEG
ncbi:uncharacterized protein LOC113205707 isoform X2 [Frankliniella occidentalis]|uniref:RanBP-type and C3HC4-type zinc finger-containing protein 1 n=1 Tax=Frankliniella occidentalis TaxID=133901 RepID=A0A9C6TQS6_FRAOC|nr:uncharacterized protein LOC113205707 isoform X2 [Frankliniella occidentalis]